jgi:protein-tyrosine phosphatase
MEYFKSMFLVGYDKVNFHLNRLDYKISPERESEESNLLSKINYFMFSEPTLIIDKIYLGNGNNAANLNTLEKHNINVIINVTSELDNYFENDFTYYKFELLDEKENDMKQYFSKFLEIIKNHKEDNILIHCFMGSSRSAIIVLLYLIKIKNMNFEDSLILLKQKRDIVNINVLFIEQLKEFLS